MSDFVVPVTRVLEINPHPNADKLELAIVNGWQICVGKGDFQKDDLVIHVPPDAIIPEKLGVEWKVWDYTSRGRVKHIKLRKEPSFGFIIPVTGDAYEDGTDVAKTLGITKYEPPVRNGCNSKVNSGNRTMDLTGFPVYTSINNLRHFPSTFKEGEFVWITEKIHGTNSRVGIVNGVEVAGSHRLRRWNPSATLSQVCWEWYQIIKESDDKWKMTKRAYANIKQFLRKSKSTVDASARGTYWHPWEIPGVALMLRDLAEDHKTVVLYGEIYGPGIQSMTYGVPEGELGYRAFDLKIDGKFMRFSEMCLLLKQYGVPTVECDGCISYSLENVARYSSKRSLMPNTNHIREGVVVRPLAERNDPRHGRAIMKYINDDYLFANQSDFTEE